MQKPPYYLLLTITLASFACKQPPQKEQPIPNHFTLLYAVDQYRNKVADSLKPLIPILDSILESDQKYRYGTTNNEAGMKLFNSHKKEIRETDSLNVIKITAILDKYGWLGPKTIGIAENKAFFLVIQHADSATQDKYLPMVREAVKNKLEPVHNLTLLEDRLSLKKTKYQLYGTQLIYSPSKKRYCLMPILDPEHLLDRRAEIGLAPMSLNMYLKSFNTVWDIEQYKTDLPEVQAFLLKMKK